MDFFLLAPFAPTLFWLLPLAFAIGLLKSPWMKGYLGELLVRLFAHWRLDKQTYRRLHNVTLSTPDGTTQIDHVFLSRYSVFVVEKKNLSGWIFGSERQAQWTQKLYKSTFRFQNPLRQNYKHRKASEAVLGVSPEHLHSVITFVDGSPFKTKLAQDIGFVRYIRLFLPPGLSDIKIDTMLHTCKPAAARRSYRRKHIQNFNRRSGSDGRTETPRRGNALLITPLNLEQRWYSSLRLLGTCQMSNHVKSFRQEAAKALHLSSIASSQPK